MTRIELNGGISDREALYGAIYSQLGAPESGKNLDALWDVLTSLGTPCEIRIADSDALRGALGPYFDRLLRVLSDAAAQNTGVSVIFQ